MINNIWVFGLIGVLGLAGCATTQGDWEKAQQSNTIDAYERFLQKHYRSEFDAQAKSRIHDLEWQKAKHQDTIMAYENFLRWHPQSEFGDEAKSRIHDLEWQEAEHLNEIQYYRRFKDRYPRSKFSNEAYQRMERLAWKETRKLNTVTAYQEFVLAYPQSKFTRVYKSDKLGITVQELNQHLANALGYTELQTNGGILVLTAPPKTPGFKDGDILVSIDGEKSTTFDGWKAIIKENDPRWEKAIIWRYGTYFTTIRYLGKTWTVEGRDVDVKQFKRSVLKYNKEINSKIKTKADALRLKGKPDEHGYSDSNRGLLEVFVYVEQCSDSPYGPGSFYFFYFNKDGNLVATRCDSSLEIHSH